MWLMAKIKSQINIWYHRWLSRVSRLVLVKSVLEAVLVYWMSLAWIPKGVIHKIQEVYCRFLQRGKKEGQFFSWVKWDHIALPKKMGGWGFKNLLCFSKALAAKIGWKLISLNILWTQIVINKYISPLLIEEQIRLPTQKNSSASTVWKVVLNSTGYIEAGLTWRIGSRVNFSIGVDAWLSSGSAHILPHNRFNIWRMKA